MSYSPNPRNIIVDVFYDGEPNREYWGPVQPYLKMGFQIYRVFSTTINGYNVGEKIKTDSHPWITPNHKVYRFKFSNDDKGKKAMTWFFFICGKDFKIIDSSPKFENINELESYVDIQKESDGNI